jgi:predicted RNA-binding Zn ribbon-like protein
MSPVAESRVFKLSGGHPALDLVNTLDWRFRDREPDELLASYADLLGFVEQCNLLKQRQARQLERDASVSEGERVLSEARQLREALAGIFYAQLDGHDPPAGALRTLERLFKQLRERQKLTWDGARCRWNLSGMEDSQDFPLWLLARSASKLLLSSDMQMLRSCGDPECGWLFLDTSKNHSRRWCDMKVCGNRMKARRFKAQQREG